MGAVHQFQLENRPFPLAVEEVVAAAAVADAALDPGHPTEALAHLRSGEEEEDGEGEKGEEEYVEGVAGYGFMHILWNVLCGVTC